MLTVIALGAAAGLTSATVAFGDRSGRDDARGSAGGLPHTPYVELTTGEFGAVGYHLLAWEQQDQLCMMVLPVHDDPDRLPPSGDPAVPWTGGGGCGFDHRHPDDGYVFGTTGPDGSTVSFGPLPAAATQIRLAADQAVTAYPFPAGQGLPAGRYWISVVPSAGSTGSTGSTGGNATGAGTPQDPQPLDANGRPVPFQDF